MMLEFITPLFCLLILAGTFMGIIFGSIPGLTATMAVAVCLPLTYPLGLENGLALLGYFAFCVGELVPRHAGRPPDVVV